jgi:hypothetical protein
MHARHEAAVNTQRAECGVQARRGGAVGEESGGRGGESELAGGLLCNGVELRTVVRQAGWQERSSLGQVPANGEPWRRLSGRGKLANSLRRAGLGAGEWVIATSSAAMIP